MNNKPKTWRWALLSAVLLVALVVGLLHVPSRQHTVERGEPAVFAAVRQGATETLRQHLDAHPEAVRTLDRSMRTPLHRACEVGNEEAVELLLDRGAAADARGFGGEGPIHCAAEAGCVEAAKLLLDEHAPLDRPDRDGRTPLHWAVDAGREEMVEFLLGRGANVGHRAGFALFASSTPLLRAALHGHTGVAEILLEHGAEIAARDRHGETPLHVACARGNAATARLLLERGSDINTADGEGITPLMSAVMANSTDCVRLLLDRGADVSARDQWERTALDTAESLSKHGRQAEPTEPIDPAIVEMLRTAGEQAETAAGAQ